VGLKASDTPSEEPTPAAPIGRSLRSSARRLGWGLADQAVSSITNFVLGIVVARSLGGASFGAFSLAWVTYGVVLNLSRGLATDPLTVRFSNRVDEQRRLAVAAASSTATLLGVVAGALCVVAGASLGGVVGSCFVALGLTLPGLLLQDSWRFAFFAAGQGGRALANDLVWAVTLIPTMALAASIGTAFGFVLAWGGAAVTAALYGCWQLRLIPHPKGVTKWMRDHRDLGPRYMAENLSDSLSGQLRLTGLGAISGLAAVGAVRGAQLLLGPFLALRMGISLIAVPEAGRVLVRTPRRLPLFCLVLGGSQALAGAVWGAALFLLPTSVGERLLGSLWTSAAALLLPTILLTATGSIFDGAFVGLRALGAARRSLRSQLARAGMMLVLGLAGAFLGGAEGSLWYALVGTIVGVAIVWYELLSAIGAKYGRRTAAGGP
jgi:O-antigen/teichoic acid export membrane protein